jgi:hypothetical protein
LWLAFAIQLVFFLALEVGVVALLFVILGVVLRGLANEFLNLVSREGRSGVS